VRNGRYTPLSMRSRVLAALALAILISRGAGANEDEWHWRVLDQGGVIEFKLAEVTVREEFKRGLESAGQFFDLCKRSGN
jgi:hypothetical protein